MRAPMRSAFSNKEPLTELGTRILEGEREDKASEKIFPA